MGLGEDPVDVAGDRGGDILRPALEEELRHRRGEALLADEAGERSDEDEEREHRHQHGERDMARHRPSVIVVEVAERVGENGPNSPEQ